MFIGRKSLYVQLISEEIIFSILMLANKNSNAGVLGFAI